MDGAEQESVTDYNKLTAINKLTALYPGLNPVQRRQLFQ